MKKILHIHPDRNSSNKFINPLVQMELSNGYNSHIFILNEYNLYHLINKLLVFNPDLVMIHNTISSTLPLFICRILNFKRIIYFNHGVPFIAYSGLLRYILKFIEIINIKMATETLTVSSDMVRILKSLCPKNKFTLIYNGSPCGIDLEHFNLHSSFSSSYLKNFNIKDDQIVVTFVGRPNARKGFYLALELWEKYFLNSNYVLIICGFCESELLLKSNKKTYPNVYYAGYVHDIENIYKISKFVLLPSLHEGFSYTALEASLCGCIVIGNDIPGLRLIIKKGLNGFLIKKNDIFIYQKIIKSQSESPSHSIDYYKLIHQLSKKYDRNIFLHHYNNFLLSIGF